MLIGGKTEDQEFHLHTLKHCPKLIKRLKNKPWKLQFVIMWYMAEAQKWDPYATTSFNNFIGKLNGRQCWWGNIEKHFWVW